MPFVRCPRCGEVVPNDGLSSGTAAATRHRTSDRSPGICDHCLHLEGGTGSANARAGSVESLLPLPLRVNADPRFRGRSVTIAFLDSGFFPHPDLTRPRERIRALVDVTDDRFPLRYFQRPHAESWHGTMSAVLASGSGSLSRGMYRGIADEAAVTGIKVMNTRKGHISSKDIASGIRWVLAHRTEFGIRVMNISVGGDEPQKLGASEVDRLVEEAAAAGIVVIVAGGNSPGRPVVPPASAPSAVTVGGYDDRNQLNSERYRGYPTTAGVTLNGDRKPDLLGPAMSVAGPVLPRTPQFRESRLLYRILDAGEDAAWRLYGKEKEKLQDLPGKVSRETLRRRVVKRIAEMKYAGPYRKSMEGTSVAAAVVSSIAAQLLEANPVLSVKEVREALLGTALPLASLGETMQGHGIVSPRAAVEQALLKRHPDLIPGPSGTGEWVSVLFESAAAGEVTLAGDFNGWDPRTTPFQQMKNGWWSVIVPKPRHGAFRYKIVLDASRWVEDPASPSKEADGFGGWNSVFHST